MPDVLVPFMGGRTFIPFTRAKPVAVSHSLMDRSSNWAVMAGSYVAAPSLLLCCGDAAVAWFSWRSVDGVPVPVPLLVPLLPRDDPRHSCAWTDFPGPRLTSGAMETTMPARTRAAPTDGTCSVCLHTLAYACLLLPLASQACFVCLLDSQLADASRCFMHVRLFSLCLSLYAHAGQGG